MNNIHKSVTLDRLIELARSNFADCTNIGVCLACGEDAPSVEPDAAKYKCDMCGANEVYGVEEVMMRGLVSDGNNNDIPPECEGLTFDPSTGRVE